MYVDTGLIARLLPPKLCRNAPIRGPRRRRVPLAKLLWRPIIVIAL